MSKTIHQKMHDQHRRWERDYETWQADVDRWKRELRDALEDLGTVESAIKDHQEALSYHADTVWEGQQRLRAHELRISEESKAGLHKTDEEWAAVHSQNANQYEQAKQAHKRIKMHHHGIIVEAARLLKKLRAAL